MTTPHDLEDAVRDRFERAMSDTTAPVAELQSSAMTRGRRLRRRRQSLLAVGAVAAIAVTGIGVQYAAGGTQAKEANDFTQGGKPSATTSVEAAPSPSGGMPSPGPLEVPSGNPGSEAEGWWSMPASTMATELRRLLPAGMRLTDPETTNTDRAPGEPLHELEGYLTAILRPEAGGPGKVNMVLYPATAEEEPPADGQSSEPDGEAAFSGEADRLSCSPEAVNDPADCRQLRSPDGTVIGRVLDSTDGGVRSLGIDLLTEDGGIVMINVANTLADKWPMPGTASAEEIPLTLGQLRRIAENPVWTSYQP